MSSIFLSYRRQDAPGHAGRIYDRLVERFGKDNVYMDLDSTAPGADFGEVIDSVCTPRRSDSGNRAKLDYRDAPVATRRPGDRS